MSVYVTTRIQNLNKAVCFNGKFEGSNNLESTNGHEVPQLNVEMDIHG